MSEQYVDDLTRINNMIENIDFCIENLKEIDENIYCTNKNVQYSLNMALQIICENANHITEDTKNLSPNTKWKEMKTTRNIISHEYGLIMLDILYDTFVEDLPQLKKELENIIKYKELEEKYKNYMHGSNIAKEELEKEIKDKPIEIKINIINNKLSKIENPINIDTLDNNLKL